MPNNSQSKGQRPVETLTMPSLNGRVEVAIWRNVKGDGEAGERISFSATLTRSYFDAGKEEWKRTSVLFLADLLPTALLLQRAAEKIAAMQT